MIWHKFEAVCLDYHCIVIRAAATKPFQPLSENDFYFIFSKEIPDALVRAFQHSLEAIRKERNESGISQYEQIIYKYLGVGCTRQTFSEDAVIALVNLITATQGSDGVQYIVCSGNFKRCE